MNLSSFTVWQEVQNLVGKRMGYAGVFQMPDFGLATSDSSGRTVKNIGS